MPFEETKTHLPVIRKVDVLVHPFYNYVPGEHPSFRRRSWEKSVDVVARSKDHVMIFIRTPRTKLEETASVYGMGKRRKITRGAVLRAEKALIDYARRKLGRRLILEEQPAGPKLGKGFAGQLRELGRLQPNFKFYAYGESALACVQKAAFNIAFDLRLPNPRGQLKFRLDKSVGSHVPNNYYIATPSIFKGLASQQTPAENREMVAAESMHFRKLMDNLEEKIRSSNKEPPVP